MDLALHAPLQILIVYFLLLQNVNVAKSQVPPIFEAVSFGMSSFDPDNPNIVLLDDASIHNGVLSLSKTDPQGVGRAEHVTPIHLWDRTSGNLADFTAGFTFVVNPGGSSLHGDGFAFFLEPISQGVPKNSSGGYLGLFSPDTAFDPTKNRVLAFEFDSFANPWDPQYPHIGIDVGSIKSVATAPWPSGSVAGSSVGSASINYNSESKRLTFFMSYNGTGKNATVSCMVDLRDVLPEFVRVGFSGATGQLVESHDVLAFGFENAL